MRKVFMGVTFSGSAARVMARFQSFLAKGLRSATVSVAVSGVSPGTSLKLYDCPKAD
jgi:hypothetical protein